MRKLVAVSMAAGAAGAGLLLLLLAGLGLGWGDIVIVVGTNTVGNAGSVIGGLGITNGTLSFWATNSTPTVNTNAAKWVSVVIPGETNAYRLPLSY